MTLRNILLTLGLLLLISLSYSITYEQLEEQAELFYGNIEVEVQTEDGYDVVWEPATEESLVQGDAVFLQFMSECEDVKLLEDAALLWRYYAPSRYKDWIETVTSDANSPLKYFYLWFDNTRDELSRINAGRKLALEYPQQVYGYRLMLKGYFENYPFEDYFEDYEAVTEMLEQDLPLLLTYYQGFDTDGYHEVAGIFYYAYSDQMSSAAQILTKAYKNHAYWLELLDLERIQPIEMWHELIYAYVLMVQEDDDSQYIPYSFEDIAIELASYYYEDLQQYDRVIKILANNADVYDNYYLRFILADSYFQSSKFEPLSDVLITKDDLEDSVSFLKAWLEFDSEGAQQVYQTALAENPEPQARYLISKLDDQMAQSLQIARTIVKDQPREKIGYQLFSDTYLDYFGSAQKNDPQRDEWVQNFKKDKGILSSFYIRYPENLKAQVSVLFSRLLDENHESVKKFYSIIVEHHPFSEEAKLVDKLIVDQEMYDLLWDVKDIFIDQMIKTGILDEDEKQEFKVITYASSLYASSEFEQLLFSVNEHPQWMEYEDIQFMLVNANYQLQDYATIIDILGFMLEKETIDYGMLLSLADTPVAEQEAWPALMEYAQEIYQTDVEEQEEPDFEPYPAPEWTLPDAEGNLIKLKDYLGQIVILDFWASWCAPCQRSMPLIHEWMQNDMPEGVQVFSINVWENDIETAINYMTENGFEMKLLFGKDDTPVDYAVQGIPFLVVIDKDGNVRFTETGFSPDLKDKLTSWVKQLQ